MRRTKKRARSSTRTKEDRRPPILTSTAEETEAVIEHGLGVATAIVEQKTVRKFRCLTDTQVVMDIAGDVDPPICPMCGLRMHEETRP